MRPALHSLLGVGDDLSLQVIDAGDVSRRHVDEETLEHVLDHERIHDLIQAFCHMGSLYRNARQIPRHSFTATSLLFGFHFIHRATEPLDDDREQHRREHEQRFDGGKGPEHRERENRKKQHVHNV